MEGTAHEDPRDTAPEDPIEAKLIDSGDPHVKHVCQYLHTLSMQHTTNLSDLLIGRHQPYAGDIYIDETGRPEHLGEMLPRHVIPMMAAFVLPFTDHFRCKLVRAKQYILDRRRYRPDADHPFIIVPIQSPGGNIELLKQILDTLDHFRSSTGVQVVAYLSGMVASCAFILAQACDHIVTDSTAEMLCHDPSQSQMVAADPQNGMATLTQTAGQAAMTDMDLELTHNDIYRYAELGVLLRYMTTHADNGLAAEGKKWQHNSLLLLETLLNKPHKLREWRQLYYDKHKVKLNQMHAEMMKTKVPLTYNSEKNILDFITRDVALDRNGFTIKTQWLLDLDIVDAIKVDITLSQEDHCSITLSLREEVMQQLAKVDNEYISEEKATVAKAVAKAVAV